MTNSVDPDQLASEEASWSGSALFAKTGHVVFSKRSVNKDIFSYPVLKYMWKKKKKKKNTTENKTANNNKKELEFPALDL